MVERFTSYKIENDREFQAKLTSAKKQVGDLRFEMGEISRSFFRFNKEQFSLKGSGRYPPLSPKYAIRKRKMFGQQPIMVAKGRLRDSLTGQPNRDSILSIGKNSLVLGTKVEYAIFHQSDKPRTKLPQRKVLFIDEQRRIAFLQIINKGIERKLKRSGFNVG